MMRLRVRAAFVTFKLGECHHGCADFDTARRRAHNYRLVMLGWASVLLHVNCWFVSFPSS